MNSKQTVKVKNASSEGFRETGSEIWFAITESEGDRGGGRSAKLVGNDGLEKNPCRIEFAVVVSTVVARSRGKMDELVLVLGSSLRGCIGGGTRRRRRRRPGGERRKNGRWNGRVEETEGEKKEDYERKVEGDRRYRVAFARNESCQRANTSQVQSDSGRVL